MIKLKNILFELKTQDITRLLNKINNNEYRFFDQGDNGRVYEIDGEEWIITSAESPRANTRKVKLSKRFATKEKPLAAFFVDEAQDSNPIIEKVLLDFFNK